MNHDEMFDYLTGEGYVTEDRVEELIERALKGAEREIELLHRQVDRLEREAGALEARLTDLEK